MSTERESLSAPGDRVLGEKNEPSDWIYAAGNVLKERDGPVRKGWENRFAVLTEVAFFWFKRRKDDENFLKRKKNDMFMKDDPIGEQHGRILLSKLIAVYHSDRSLRLTTNKDVVSLMFVDAETAARWEAVIKAAKDGNRELVQEIQESLPSVEREIGITRLGFLEKKREEIRKGWTNRFFVLTNKTLCYYKVKDPRFECFGDLRATFPLKEIKRASSTGESSGCELELITVRPILHDRRILLRACSQKECQDWIDAINGSSSTGGGYAPSLPSTPRTPSPRGGGGSDSPGWSGNEVAAASPPAPKKSIAFNLSQKPFVVILLTTNSCLVLVRYFPLMMFLVFLLLLNVGAVLYFFRTAKVPELIEVEDAPSMSAPMNDSPRLSSSVSRSPALPPR
jgi:hypothetical protein